MEGQLIKYRLIQKNASYILSASTIGNEIKITIENSNSSYSQTFSVATWKTIGAVFESINTAVDAIQWIKNAMKVHKVKVIEEGSIIKLMFAITEGNKTRHYVIIPISGNSEKASSISAQYNTTSFATSQIAEVQPLTQSIQQNYSQYQSQQYIPQPTITLPTNTSTTTTTNTITTTAYTTLNDKFNYAELGIDPSKVRKSIVNINSPDIAKSIEAEQKLRLSQVGKVTTELPKNQTVASQLQTQSINYSQYQSQQYIPQSTLTIPSSVPAPVPKTTTEYTTVNDKFNFAELGIDPSKVRKSIVNINSPDIAKSIEAEQKLRLSQIGKVTTELPKNQTISSQYISQSTVAIPAPVPVFTPAPNTTKEYTALNDKFNYAELGIDPSKVRKSIVNINGPDMAKSIDAEQKLRLSQVGKITTENYVPEDKVVIPYQVIEKPVSGETANTFTNNTVTSSTFNRPYISPADGIITNTYY